MCHPSPPNDVEFTAAPLTVANLLSTVPIVRPEFIRLPPPGSKCLHTGLSRSALNSLVLPTPENGFSPVVKSFVLRKRGAKTGIRLVDFASLVSFIRSNPAVETAHPGVKGGQE